MSTAAVRIRNLTKSYRIYPSAWSRTIAPFRKTDTARQFHALKDLTLDFPEGEVVAVLGRNGSGKSTLMKTIAGVCTPSSGTVEVNGRVSAMLELTSGFDPELTGRENIYLRALALGIPKEETDASRDEIIEFADIGDHIDQPVRTYSSGMRSRLGFAVSVSVEPDILIVDEALSVGDEIFKLKCIDKMEEIRDRGATILFVSHSLGTVQAFCTQAVWINRGRLRRQGEVGPVVLAYKEFLKRERGRAKSAGAQDTGQEQPATGKRDVVDVGNFRLCDVQSRTSRRFWAGDDIWFEFEYEVKRHIQRMTMNFSVHNAEGVEVYTSDKQDPANVVNSEPGQHHARVCLKTPQLLAGSYTLTGELWNNDSGFFIRYARDQRFRIRQEQFRGTGITPIAHEVASE